MNAIGYILDKELGGNSTRIKVLGIKNGKGYKLEEAYILDKCPPYGHSFAPSFFNKYPYNSGEFIKFSIVDNPLETNLGEDETIVDESKSVRPITGYDIIELDINPVQRNHIGQEMLKSINTFGAEKFYLKYKNSLYGSFKFKGEMIVPVIGKEVKCWELNEEIEIISYNNRQIILAEPKEPYELVDCMNPTQLEDWFTKQIYVTQSKFIQAYYSKKELKTELNKVFSTTLGDQLQKSRFERVMEGLEQLVFTKEQIIELAATSEKFQNLFNERIDVLKNEFSKELKEKYEAIEQDYQKDLEHLKRDITEEKKAIGKTKKQKEKLNNEIRFLKGKEQQLKKETAKLKTNYERLISDLKIHAGIFQTPNTNRANTSVEQKTKSFLLGTYTPDEKVANYKDKKAFKEALKNNLCHYGEYYNRLQNKVFDVLANFDYIFIKNTKVACAILKSVNNCTFIIQQVEADWLKFKQFWENGLGEIWESSHANPEILHFLVLQDFNLSSPICFARPLLDIISGIRNKLPYANTGYPPNLKILASKLPPEIPEDLALPMYQNNFLEWGLIPIKEVVAQEEPCVIQQDKFITLNQLSEWNEKEKEEIVFDLADYFQD